MSSLLGNVQFDTPSYGVRFARRRLREQQQLGAADQQRALEQRGRTRAASEQLMIDAAALSAVRRIREAQFAHLPAAVREQQLRMHRRLERLERLL